MYKSTIVACLVAATTAWEHNNLTRLGMGAHGMVYKKGSSSPVVVKTTEKSSCDGGCSLSSDLLAGIYGESSAAKSSGKKFEDCGCGCDGEKSKAQYYGYDYNVGHAKKEDVVVEKVVVKPQPVKHEVVSYGYGGYGGYGLDKGASTSYGYGVEKRGYGLDGGSYGYGVEKLGGYGLGKGIRADTGYGYGKIGYGVE